MKTFYVLIDKVNGLHFGWTFDEEAARVEADTLTKYYESQIEIYEFRPHDEFQRD